MKAAIVVGSRNEQVRAYFSSRQEAAIPNTYRGKENGTFSSVKLYCFDPENAEAETFRDYVLSIALDYDAVACMVCSTDYDWVEGCENVFFVAFFQTPPWNGNLPNFFSSHIRSWMKNFIYLAGAGIDQKKKIMLLLPKNAFQSPETTSVAQQLKDKACDSTFIRTLQSYYSAMSSRRSPKRKGCSGSDVFFVDDKKHFFQFGDEEHAEAEENSPHNFYCRAGKYLRFGVLIGDKRHFNVSEEKPKDRIHVELAGCHGEPRIYGPKPHLNIFPNGYIE